MATSNPMKTSRDKTEEEMQLEAKLQAMTKEKKALSDVTRKADERVREIREEAGQIEDRLDRIRKEQREAQETRLEAHEKTTKQEAVLQAKALKSENDRFKEQLLNMEEELTVLRRENSEQNESLKKVKESLQRTTNYSKTQQKANKEQREEIEKLNRYVKCLEDDISQLHDQDELMRAETARVAELQAELEVLRKENEQLKTDSIEEMIEQIEVRVSQRQNESLAELKENLQRITSLWKTEQKKIKCLEGEKADQQIAVETQLRQLNELESREKLTEEMRQLKETLTTLHRQHQQPTTVEHRQGKYINVCLK